MTWRRFVWHWIVPVAALPLLGVGALITLLMGGVISWQPYRGTLVVLSETPLASIEAAFDGEVVPPTVWTGQEPRVIVWEALRVRTAEPRVTMHWTLPDGTRRGADQVMRHEPEWPRCIYVLRLDARGEPRPAGAWRGAAQPLDRVCLGDRHPYTPPNY